MGLNPAHRLDQGRRAKRQTEQVRQLRVRPRGHAEAKTFIVPGSITAGMDIPPFFVAVDPDETIPEVKLLFELRGFLASGTVDIEWTLNGVLIPGSAMTVTTVALDSQTLLAAPGVRLAHGDYLQPSVTADTSAASLSLAAFIVTRQA